MISAIAVLFASQAAAAEAAAPGALEGLKAHALALGLALGGPLAIGALFVLAGRMVPGLIAGRLQRLFAETKASAWWRDSAHPKRARWLLATAELLEDEVPDPGQGQEVYDAFGAWANARAKIGVLPLGSAAQWANLARKGGDAIDLELDAEIVEIAKMQTPVPSDSTTPSA
mgnify:CR=1 FL=1